MIDYVLTYVVDVAVNDDPSTILRVMQLYFLKINGFQLSFVLEELCTFVAQINYFLSTGRHAHNRSSRWFVSALNDHYFMYDH